MIAAPKILFLLILIPLLVLLFLYHLYWKKKQQKEFGNSIFLKNLSPNYSQFKPVLKFALLLVSLTAIIIALSNPKYGVSKEFVKVENIDVVFAIDVSKSMLAEDIQPNRLEKAKQITNQLLNGFGNYRVGMVAYAGSAFPVLPMTTDYSIAKMYVQNLNTNSVSSQGTALNEAISLANTFFDASNTSKVIILLSDGEDHAASFEKVVDQAALKGIKIITIGLGTEKGAAIPYRVANNVIEGYVTDKNGEIVISKLNPETLKSIAGSTNGVYVNNTLTQAVVKQITKTLTQVEKKEFGTQQVAEQQTQYQWFLGLALLLLLLDLIIFSTKTSWIQKWNLFNDK